MKDSADDLLKPKSEWATAEQEKRNQCVEPLVTKKAAP